MRDDELQARIDVIERALYNPRNYAVNVINPSLPAQAERLSVSDLAEELNRLRAEQIRRAAQKFGPRAPIGGQRLSTGDLPSPEPPEPEVHGRKDYDPYDESTQDWRQR